MCKQETLPEEPSARAVVVDCDGDAWQRSYDGLWRMAGESVVGWDWEALTRSYSPVQVVYTP
ncbi:hypothetical protein [Nonomuraea roseola]|uniref:Uncharacterized protein n=1 Tax=Nonomuraea roseola TaxID=46179 RepID=A0ABV5Q0Q6_9ACTN